MPIFTSPPSTCLADRLLYGADYNPEQWPESVWEEDMRLMKDAGVNLVSVGIFSWAKLQSAPGVFHFSWLDRLMDLLAEHGIAANLATATASPPTWLVRRYPEILPVLPDGTVLSPGSRQHYNPSSRAFRAACAELVEALALRYKDHPALAMWHINNEYACHVAADYGEETAAAFRDWLRNRYGNLDALNEIWGTAFWSQHYYDWEEILPPRTVPVCQNPALQLDFQRFSDDALLECCRLEAGILRRITPDKPVTTNFMAGFKPLDYRKWSREIDFTCIDVYPDPADPSVMMAMASDLTRSLKDGAPWMVMEQVTTHVNWRPRNVTKPPGIMRLWSYSAIARGADGICFFQWRQSRAGAEKFHGALVGHGDPDKQRCFRESRQLGNELAQLGEIAGSRCVAEIGILFDYDNWWAIEIPGKPNNHLQYQKVVESVYRPLVEQNLAVDFVFEDSDLSRYKILFAPALYLMKPGLAEKLESFTADGGILVVTYFSGIVDEYDRILLGGYPASLRRLLGMTVEEWAVPPEGRENLVLFPAESGFAASYQSSFWAEVVHCDGAEMVGHFSSDYFAGNAAVTRNAFARGEAWYLATEFEPAFYRDLARLLAQKADITPPLQAPSGVEVTRRVSEEAEYLFLINHGDSPANLDLGNFCGTLLLTEEKVGREISLPSMEVLIIRLD